MRGTGGNGEIGEMVGQGLEKMRLTKRKMEENGGKMQRNELSNYYCFYRSNFPHFSRGSNGKLALPTSLITCGTQTAE